MIRILIMIVIAYRTIPAPVRRIWSMSGPGTSGTALDRLRHESSAAAALRYFLHCATPFRIHLDKQHPDFPFKSGWDNLQNGPARSGERHF